jgi:hypothetical protein
MDAKPKTPRQDDYEDNKFNNFKKSIMIDSIIESNEET